MPFLTTQPLGQPDEGAWMLDRTEAKWRGLLARVEGHALDRSRLRTRLSPRLTHPHTLARIESDVRDERYEVGA